MKEPAPRDASPSPWLYRSVRMLVHLVCRPVFRIKIVGAARLPRGGAYIVAPTHRSLADVPFTSLITSRRVRFLAKEELFGNRVGRWFFSNLGAVPVARGTADRGALRVLERVLRDGDPVALFPEGTRTEGPTVAPLFDGAAYLAVKLGVPIVPVGVGGTEHILPKGRALPKVHRVAVVVGEPILPPPSGTGPRRRAAAEMTASLAESLQACLDEAMKLAG